MKAPRDPVEVARRVMMPRAFGKFGGKSLGWIVDNQAWYVAWLSGIEIRRQDVRDAVRVLRLAYRESIDRSVVSREALRG